MNKSKNYSFTKIISCGIIMFSFCLLSNGKKPFLDWCAIIYAFLFLYMSIAKLSYLQNQIDRVHILILRRKSYLNKISEVGK